jgi:hypothetical protein
MMEKLRMCRMPSDYCRELPRVSKVRRRGGL